MDFPQTLWNDPQDRELVAQAVELFSTVPLVLTDTLTNSVYLNSMAESVFADRAEALVNRAASSLLGFGEKEDAPAGLTAALLGTGPAWRGISNPEGRGPRLFCEASAIRRDGRLLCGILRFETRPR